MNQEGSTLLYGTPEPRAHQSVLSNAEERRLALATFDAFFVLGRALDPTRTFLIAAGGEARQYITELRAYGTEVQALLGSLRHGRELAVENDESEKRRVFEIVASALNRMIELLNKPLLGREGVSKSTTYRQYLQEYLNRTWQSFDHVQATLGEGAGGPVYRELAAECAGAAPQLRVADGG